MPAPKSLREMVADLAKQCEDAAWGCGVEQIPGPPPKTAQAAYSEVAQALRTALKMSADHDSITVEEAPHGIGSKIQDAYQGLVRTGVVVEDLGTHWRVDWGPNRTKIRKDRVGKKPKRQGPWWAVDC